MDETGLKPATLVLRKVLSIKLLARKPPANQLEAGGKSYAIPDKDGIVL